MRRTLKQIDTLWEEVDRIQRRALALGAKEDLSDPEKAEMARLHARMVEITKDQDKRKLRDVN
jgi:hypothetical protein